jgi:acetoacetate decarboxylase
VNVQWLDLPDGEGLGAYSAAAQVIPCTFKGEPCNFIAQMYVDNTSPLAGGREIWGYPMKFGKPSLTTRADTLTGELSYAGQLVATGTMVYKHDHGKIDLADIAEQLKRTQVTLKLIPGVDGKPAIAQLVGVTFEDVDVEGAWSGPGRVELVPSVNCPLADLPPAGAVSGLHILANMTLPYGRVLHDYLA